MTEQFANFAQSVLTSSITAAQTSITIASATTFPLLGTFRIVVQSFDPVTALPISQPELMIVTAVAGNSFTVTRGAESTGASAFAAGAKVTHILTAAVMVGLQGGAAGVSSINGLSGTPSITSTGNTITVTTPSGNINIESVNTGTVTTTGSPLIGQLTIFSGTSSITNGNLSGDITTSGSLATTIKNSAVTLAKIANATASSKVLGSGASGSGAAYTEITLGTNLSMTGTTLNATGGGSATFDAIGSGTNITATMVVSTGATLSASGSGTIAATSFTGSLVGDVTGTQGATVVGKINGTSLAGLATGILKNTTTTGVPSIAAAGTDYQIPISLTTTGTSGASTFNAGTGALNIPNYTTGSSPTFDLIGTGVNTTATMTVGTGASLTTSGSGAITATAVPASGITGTTLAAGVVTSSLTSVGTLTVLAIGGTEAITSASATALTVGLNGATNPAFTVDASAATSVTGWLVKSQATGVGANLQVTGSATNESGTVSSKGTGTMVLQCPGAGSFNIKANGQTVISGTTANATFAVTANASAVTPRFGYTGAANATLTTLTEFNQTYFNMGQTNQHATGAITTQRDFRITPMTHSAVAASTITTAAGLSVDGAPVASTNATLTTSSAIHSPGSAVGSGVADSYGLNVAANTGATRNWAAKFPGQLVYASATPGIAAGAGAGGSPTVSIAGTNEGGTINVTTGSAPTLSAVIATITYSNAAPTGSSVVLMPANASTALLSGTSMVFTTGGTTTFTLTSGSVALTTLTAYSWYYQTIVY